MSELHDAIERIFAEAAARRRERVRERAPHVPRVRGRVDLSPSCTCHRCTTVYQLRDSHNLEGQT